MDCIKGEVDVYKVLYDVAGGPGDEELAYVIASSKEDAKSKVRSSWSAWKIGTFCTDLTAEEAKEKLHMRPSDKLWN